MDLALYNGLNPTDQQGSLVSLRRFFAPLLKNMHVCVGAYLFDHDAYYIGS
jgi:hypothetical protein